MARGGGAWRAQARSARLERGMFDRRGAVLDRDDTRGESAGLENRNLRQRSLDESSRQSLRRNLARRAREGHSTSLSESVHAARLGTAGGEDGRASRVVVAHPIRTRESESRVVSDRWQIRSRLLPQCAHLFRCAVEATRDRSSSRSIGAARTFLPRTLRKSQRPRSRARRRSDGVRVGGVEMNRPHVLVVDDSAVVRQAFSMLLTQHFSVDTAADPLIAERKMQKKRPDVVVLDLQMPRMDGFTFLRQIMRSDPLPVVICSAAAARGSDAAMRALEEGAVDII